MKILTFEEAHTIEGLSKELKNKVAKRNELDTLLESENITLAIKTSTGNIVYEKKLSPHLKATTKSVDNLAGLNFLNAITLNLTTSIGKIQKELIKLLK